VPERPHAAEQRLVGVPLEIQIAEVRERGGPGIRVEVAVLFITAESLSDFDVRQSRFIVLSCQRDRQPAGTA
jgi:hypothetical protein